MPMEKSSFFDLENAFYTVPQKVMKWAMRKKKKAKVLNISVMCLHKGAKTRVRVDYDLS